MVAPAPWSRSGSKGWVPAVAGLWLARWAAPPVPAQQVKPAVTGLAEKGLVELEHAAHGHEAAGLQVHVLQKTEGHGHA